jgi:hypothetical protein
MAAPTPASRALADQGVALVPAAFLPADQVAAGLAAGELAAWVAPTLGNPDGVRFVTLSPLGAARCGVALTEALDVPEPASVPAWADARRPPPPIVRIETTADRRRARDKIRATPEPWRSVLDLKAARHELEELVYEPRPVMPARRKTTKPTKPNPRKNKRRQRLGSTRGPKKQGGPGRKTRAAA